jgi:hypothetical protein
MAEGGGGRWCSAAVHCTRQAGAGTRPGPEPLWRTRAGANETRPMAAGATHLARRGATGRRQGAQRASAQLRRASARMPRCRDATTRGCAATAGGARREGRTAAAKAGRCVCLGSLVGALLDGSWVRSEKQRSKEGAAEEGKWRRQEAARALGIRRQRRARREMRRRATAARRRAAARAGVGAAPTASRGEGPVAVCFPRSPRRHVTW